MPMRACPLVADASGAVRFGGEPWLRVRPSDIAGKGLFAARDFERGDLVCDL